MTDFTSLSRHCTGILGQPDLGTPVYLEIGTVASKCYLVAVNNAYFIAVAASEPDKILTTTSRVYNIITDALEQDVPEYAITTTIEKLAAWAGEPCWTGPCADCEGTGKVTGRCLRCNGEKEIACYCNDCDDEHMRVCPDCAPGKTRTGKTGEPVACDACKGTGQSTVLTAVRSGQIADVIVDLYRLARILSELKGDCKVWFAQHALQLRGEDWHVMLMPLREEKEPQALTVFQP